MQNRTKPAGCASEMLKTVLRKTVVAGGTRFGQYAIIARIVFVEA